MGDLLDEAKDWLSIPSISAGARDEESLRHAAAWPSSACARAGGTAEMVDTPGGAPLVVGELRSAKKNAPTVMIYGHYDVQDSGRPRAWDSPPFEPTVRDGRLYAHGATDDKGNFLPLLFVACELAKAGALPVHVRVLIEGAEETGSDDVGEWVRQDTRGADAVIVFDAGMVDADTPALAVATRGMVFAHIEVRTGTQTAHSGMYGGAALNAFHALHRALASVLAGSDGRLPEPLRVGIRPPSPAEVETWATLPGGEAELAGVGARPADPAATEEFYVRTTAEPSLDVHRISGGEARTIVVPVAEADLSVRVVGGQDPAVIAANLEQLLREALPDGAELTFSADLARPSAFDPEHPVLLAARRALERATGTAPALAAVKAGRSRSSPTSPSGASRRSSPASACRTTPSTPGTSPTASSRSTRVPPPPRRSTRNSPSCGERAPRGAARAAQGRAPSSGAPGESDVPPGRAARVRGGRRGAVRARARRPYDRARRTGGARPARRRRGHAEGSWSPARAARTRASCCGRSTAGSATDWSPGCWPRRARRGCARR